MMISAERVIATHIPRTTVIECTWAQLRQIVEQQMRLEKAQDAFLQGKISFSEYLEYCETLGVDRMDDYLNAIEDNLTITGAL